MRWEILNKKLLLSNIVKYWQLEVRFEKFDKTLSNICNWFYIEKNPTVTVLLFDPRFNMLLLVKQFRVITEFFPEDPSINWPLEAVAGSINRGESDFDCAIRECKEEVDIDIINPKKVLTYYPSPGIFGERSTLFYAEFDSSIEINKSYGASFENEDVMPIKLSLDDALQYIDQGVITDAKTIIAVLWLARNRSILVAK